MTAEDLLISLADDIRQGRRPLQEVVLDLLALLTEQGSFLVHDGFSWEVLPSYRAGTALEILRRGAVPTCPGKK